MGGCCLCCGSGLWNWDLLELLNATECINSNCAAKHLIAVMFPNVWIVITLLNAWIVIMQLSAWIVIMWLNAWIVIMKMPLWPQLEPNDNSFCCCCPLLVAGWAGEVPHPAHRPVCCGQWGLHPGHDSSHLQQVGHLSRWAVGRGKILSLKWNYAFHFCVCSTKKVGFGVVFCRGGGGGGSRMQRKSETRMTASILKQNLNT